MEDKTALEKDLELYESFRIPAGVKTIVVLLIASLIFLGYYTYHVRQKINQLSQQLIVLEEAYQKEKVQLIGEIKRLEARADCE